MYFSSGQELPKHKGCLEISSADARTKGVKNNHPPNFTQHTFLAFYLGDSVFHLLPIIHIAPYNTERGEQMRSESAGGAGRRERERSATLFSSHQAAHK
jgi:hypothetical protein